MVTNPAKPLYLREILVLRVAILINFGWVTVASILGVSVCFKKFEVPFTHESIWAIAILCVAFLIFAFNSYKYGGFLYGGVFVYVNFTLFEKYNRRYRDGKRFPGFGRRSEDNPKRPSRNIET